MSWLVSWRVTSVPAAAETGKYTDLAMRWLFLVWATTRAWHAAAAAAFAACKV